MEPALALTRHHNCHCWQLCCLFADDTANTVRVLSTLHHKQPLGLQQGDSCVLEPEDCHGGTQLRSAFTCTLLAPTTHLDYMYYWRRLQSFQLGKKALFDEGMSLLHHLLVAGGILLRQKIHRRRTVGRRALQAGYYMHQMHLVAWPTSDIAQSLCRLKVQGCAAFFNVTSLTRITTESETVLRVKGAMFPSLPLLSRITERTKNVTYL